MVDGSIDDWAGQATRFGGTLIYSRGELIYQDHLFDAHGADDGNDVGRLDLVGPLIELEPRAYVTDHPLQYAVSELGLPTYGPITGKETYGDTGLVDRADLVEVRVAADADTIWLLVRTTTLVDAAEAAVLVLVDKTPGDGARAVPFSSGLASSRADVAILLTSAGGAVVDLVTGNSSSLAPGSVAVNPDGYVNAIEAALPRSLVEDGGGLRIAVAAGVRDGEGLADLGVGPRVANVAFRTDEPVRSFFDEAQALALHGGSIDSFFTEIALADLVAGRSERFLPRTGYHDAIFVSSELISDESGENGVFQHYGVYVPGAYDASTPSPLQWWLHFRGGKAHTAAAVVPRIMQDFGEDHDTIVVSPRGRGASSWYVSKGHVDFLEVWDDVHARFSIDPDRVYLTGHSMGGWGTYLMSVLYPDRFAAVMPVAGPPTQGLVAGCDFPECNQGTDDGRPADQYTRRMLANLRNMPIAIFHGALDELVPVSGVTRQALELQQLGYRHRYYLFPTYEHYTHPIVDEWAEGARYLHAFVRNPNPPHVTYLRDMPFERATEEVRCPLGGCGLDFSFDRAYWMSELKPADPVAGVARFDGRAMAIADPPVLAVPEVGGPASPGQTGPYVMFGLAWLPSPLGSVPPLRNGFAVTLAGAEAVRLDLARMAIDADAAITGQVSTELALELRLDGGWVGTPVVSVDGAPATSSLSEGVLAVDVPPGTHTIELRP